MPPQVRASRWAQSLFRDLSSIVLSRVCAGCGCDGWPLCATCEAQLPHTALTRSLDAPAWAAGEYDRLLREIVLAHKLRGARALAPVLGLLLARSVWAATSDCSWQSITLVPIPAHRVSLRERGRDSVGEIAESAARQLRSHGRGCQVLPALKWRQELDRHTGRSARERRQLADAFVVHKRCSDGSVVLIVDDVITTGATARAALQAMRRSGMRVHAVASVASRSRAAS